MKSISILAAGALLAAAAPALAASPFDGAWKTDPSSLKMTGKPVTFAFNNGMFDCETCVPEVKVKADGQPHPVTGAATYDAMSVATPDAHTLKRTSFKDGKAVGTMMWAVSPDGAHAKTSYSGVTPNGQTIHENYVFRRVNAGEKGANLVSGSWMPDSFSESNNALVQTFKVNGDALDMSDPLGESYHAVFGGPPVPIKGSANKTLAQVKRISDHEIVETDWRDGKKIDVTDMTVSADGKTMTFVDNNLREDHHSTGKAHKM